MANKRKTRPFAAKRRKLLAEGRTEEANQMKRTATAAKKALKALERRRRRKVKATHRVSGYYKKPRNRTVSGGRMLGK